MEPNNAAQTVNAIGVNNRRSTRSKVNSGKYAEMRMSKEKKIGRSTSNAASRTFSRTPSSESRCKDR